MGSGLDPSAKAQSLLESLATTGKVVQMTGLTGGLGDLASQWARHVEEAEERLFPHLVARGPAADGPVGFCLSEHAALSACLADLAAERPTPEWLHEAAIRRQAHRTRSGVPLKAAELPRAKVRPWLTSSPQLLYFFIAGLGEFLRLLLLRLVALLGITCFLTQLHLLTLGVRRQTTAPAQYHSKQERH